PRHLDALDLGGHGGGLEEADPDRQVELVFGVLEDDDRGFGHRVQGQAADRHLNRIFPFHHANSPSDWEFRSESTGSSSPTSEVAVAPVMRTGASRPR